MKWLVGLLVTLAVLVAGALVVISMNQGDPPLPPAQVPSATPAPSPTPTPTVGTDPFLECSATPLADSQGAGTAGLPAAVAGTRAAIIEAAIDCDYRRLQELALEGRDGFGYSFGADGPPATFWREREREAREQRAAASEYMRFLVQTLELPYCEEEGPDGETYFVWPRVHCRDRTDADWEDIRGLYPDELIEEMRSGDIFYGFRVGILDDGDWVYFIAGD